MIQSNFIGADGETEAQRGADSPQVTESLRVENCHSEDDWALAGAWAAQDTEKSPGPCLQPPYLSVPTLHQLPSPALDPCEQHSYQPHPGHSVPLGSSLTLSCVLEKCCLSQGFSSPSVQGGSWTSLPRKELRTDFPGSHSLRGGDNRTRDDQSVAPTKRVLSVCRCWVQHSCSNGSFWKAVPQTGATS